MKEQINRLARGEFEYEVPQMTLSDRRLSLCAAMGKNYSGSFKLTSNTRPVKGVCYSDNDRVVVENSAFEGVANVIRYTVITDGFELEESINGCFYIVTDAGELELPYSFKIVAQNVPTSMGNVSNLFHFANLVQTEPEAASKLFMSEEFERIFLNRSSRLSAVYRVLKGSSDIFLAMEEFLIAAGKKKVVNIHAGNTARQYGAVTENIKDTVIMNRDGWGYFVLDIATDCDFIVLSKKQVRSDEFAGSRYELEYLIDYSKLHGGRNYGTVTISTPRQVITVSITAWSVIQDVTVKLDNDRLILELFNKYLSFRSRRIDFKEWIEATTDIAQQLWNSDSHNYFAGLVCAQCKALLQEKEHAAVLLEEIHSQIMDSRNYEVLYGYYLYVSSLIAEDEKESARLLAMVNDLYAGNSSNWRIFWVLMHMDRAYEQNKSMKLAQIKSLFYKGMASPIMYYEAVSVLNEQPYLLRMLDDFEVQVLIFACKRGLIGKNLLRQVCDLCRDYKFEEKKVLKLLRNLYALTGHEGVLEILCSLLIRMQIRDSRYIAILEESINHGFRIAGLYEAYMEMKSENDYGQLPRMVLLYFSYNNALDAGRRALLYANIIVNKEKDMETYHSYRKIMEEFCFEQIGLGNISSNLAIIYREFWCDALYGEKYALQLSSLVFANRFECRQRDIAGLYICHKELEDAIQIQLMNGVGYGSVYTEDCGVVFVDRFGRRFCGSVEYRQQELLDKVADYEKIYAAVGVANHLFDVHMAERVIQYRYTVKNADLLFAEIYEHAPLSGEFRKCVARYIATYYYETYSGNAFDSIYESLSEAGLLYDLTAKERTYIIETCIAHSMMMKAKELIERFGVGQIYPARLMRLCKSLIEALDEQEDASLIWMCYRSFVNHKYDESILTYLAMYYNGPTADMIKLWEACVSFQVEAWELEERLLAQMLFTHSTSTKMEELFASYNSTGSRHRMVEAYLGYHCYNYFVHKIIISRQVVELVEARLNYSKEELLVEKLALLKYYSDADRLSDKQLSLCGRLMEELCSQKIYFGFYKKLIGRVPVPMAVLDKSYIEYRTNPKCHVTIHYMVEGGESGNRFMAQEMTPAYDGIFVKELTLFYGDCVQYYIVEKDGDREVITESRTLTNDKINPVYSQGRFECINDLLSCQELKDFVTLRKLLNSYVVKDYASMQLFKPMD